jgi:2,5-diketo-D-gluconate reductase B
MHFAESDGARIPLLGLGTWELRGAGCSRTVEQALHLGYRHIDTAEMYDNEADVGEGLRKSGIARNEIFVTTKVWPEHFATSALLRSAQHSLNKLKLDYVDLLLLHWPSSLVPLEETVGALNEAKERGYMKHIGISNFDVGMVGKTVKLSKAPIVNNQIKLNPYSDQPEVIAACKRRDISVTAHTPIAKGGVAKDKILASIGAAHKKSAAQVSLRCLVQRGFIVIPRTSKTDRLVENAAIFDFELSAGEMEMVRAVASSKRQS